MSHATVRDRLGDYLEGDLDVAARAAVEAHLGECPTCREELRGLRATVALLRGLPDPVPPADLASAVMARIGSERRPRVIRDAFRRLDASGVAGLLAAGLAGLILFATWPRSLEPTLPGAQQRPAAEPAAIAKASGGATDGPVRGPSRPALVSQPSVAHALPARTAAFARGGVAPVADVGTLSEDSLERELDRQLDMLADDPSAFLARMGPSARSDRFARLAQHAARRGRAANVASRLIAVPHPLADDLVPRFLAASLVADFESGRIPAR